VDFIVNENHKIKFLIDTGASVNVLPKHIFDKINNKNQMELNPTNQILKSYNGSAIKTYGTIVLKCRRKGNTNALQFFVVEK